MAAKEDPEQVKKALCELRRGIEAKAIIKDVSKLTDNFLLRFLRARNFDIESSVTTFVKCAKTKTKVPELFLYPSELKMVFDDNILSVLKDKTPKGESICVIRLANWSDENYDYDCILAAAFVTLEVLLMDEEVQRNGCIQILDLKDVDFDQLVSIEGYQVKRLTKIFNKFLPVRICDIYIVNDEKKAQLMAKKLKERVSEEEFNKFHFYGTDLTGFHEEIPAKILPTELGGEAGDFNCDEWYKTLLENEDKIRKNWSLFDSE
ncbi:alpha-tocopherol transfer protein-like protein [Leptotrombidium deliense]|uniref:Alpha-tocopherol transfer protein-like protein n=1 Tax=Leptotrombidium deliense TaxID=299467 RepID=A0A443RZN5_9ACAR|nr:alpha-tocopherol transfer protein-like protein [Leptotrombidium deliense]